MRTTSSASISHLEERKRNLVEAPSNCSIIKKPRPCGGASLIRGGLQQTVVVLDDLRFVDVLRELIALRQTGEGSGELLGFYFDVGRDGGLAFEGLFHALKRSGLFEGNHIVNLAKIGRDVDFLAVNEDVAMVHELTGRGSRTGEAHAEDEVVETALKNAEEGQTSDGSILFGNHEETAELAFVYAVEFLQLLLLKKLGSVLGRLPFAIRAMLARTIRTTLEFLAGLRSAETEVTSLLPFGVNVP